MQLSKYPILVETVWFNKVLWLDGQVDAVRQLIVRLINTDTFITPGGLGFYVTDSDEQDHFLGLI